MEVSDKFHTSAALSVLLIEVEKGGEPQNWSERFREEKSPLPLPIFEPQTTQPSV